MKKYDYIFIGAGCAGLSLLTRMIDAGLINGKKILLIDREPKQSNDRTWCFWENNPGFFESIVCKKWNKLWFHSNTLSRQLNIDPYQYKMIRGIDFYNYCFNKIQQHNNIDIVYGSITDLSFTESVLNFRLNDEPYSFSNAIIFNSIQNNETIDRKKSIHLLQHFKGWMVETAAPFFKPGEAVLMDFRVAQNNGTTFVYVLPLSETKALIEYTLFSENILPDKEYNNELANYLQQLLHVKDYIVTAEEFGIIPLTNARFPWYANGMYHIGTAGGQTKASSGYTFQFIQKQSDAIIKQIKENTLNAQVQPAAVSKRFHFYDAILLQVLAKKYATGEKVFTTLFKKNQPAEIFSFLDNESSLMTDLGIIQSLPSLPFIKAAYKHLLRQ